jgi:hypothetical protein
LLREEKIQSKAEEITLLNTSHKGIYLTSYSAASKKKIEQIISKYKNSVLDTIVIDIKDVEGIIGIDVTNSEIKKYGAVRKIIPNFPELINKLHQEKIKVTVRIAVFKDARLAKKRPDLAVQNRFAKTPWQTKGRAEWVDPFSEEVQDYNIRIAEYAAQNGADEIQFDYIRFPTENGSQNFTLYSHNNEDLEKYEAIENFLLKASSALKPYKVSIAVDVFGIILWQKDVDIRSTGQRVEEMAKYVHVISPMLYPSHFDYGFDGFKRPGDNPYYFLNTGCKKAIKLLEGTGVKIVPWIQGFSWRASSFGPSYINQQIKAIKDAGLDGFLIWNAGNSYDTVWRTQISTDERR